MRSIRFIISLTLFACFSIASTNAMNVSVQTESDAMLSYQSFSESILSTDLSQIHSTGHGHNRKGEHHDLTIVEKEEEEDKSASHRKLSGSSNFFAILALVIILGHISVDATSNFDPYKLFHSLAPNKRYLLLQVFRI